VSKELLLVFLIADTPFSLVKVEDLRVVDILHHVVKLGHAMRRCLSPNHLTVILLLKINTFFVLWQYPSETDGLIFQLLSISVSYEQTWFTLVFLNVVVSLVFYYLVTEHYLVWPFSFKELLQ
jgi:hypothetical protein